MISSESIRPVLLIEDDALLGLTLKRQLEGMPGCHDVHHVETCVEAESVWSGLNPWVVLADYRLTDGWGTDVVSVMRKRGYRTPVVMLTGDAEAIPEDMVDALDLVAVLAKPVDEASLRACLSTLVASPPLPAEPPPRRIRRMGRFRLLVLRNALTRRHVRRLICGAGEYRWIGLVVPTGLKVEPDGFSALRDWAGQLSASGGRLGLVVADDEQRRMFTSQCADWIDVFESADRLAVEGGRLMGRAERSRVLHVTADESLNEARPIDHG